MSFEIRKSKVLVQLLKGPLYRDALPVLWQDLLIFREQVAEYFSHLGLQLFVHDDNGFAFLRQESENDVDSDENSIPRLIQKRELSFELSVLMVLLEATV